ncbi:hypothetical protein FH972_021565 [Carpinus fangiana]|uniref:Laccase n=1 Tax=Carpinus fangiana TaxID=176857 RepID=A0A5N6KQ18_9ROSI|nr:hypothetical protein FH972_021565 [Carpinus fangiana]
MFAACLLMISYVVATSSSSSSLASAQLDFGNVRLDHILWGEHDTQLHSAAKRDVSTSSTRVADPACSNSPSTRSCWSQGFNVATDFDAKWPTTGKTVSVHCQKLVINTGADWGDRITVTIRNKMQDNGTSIHWHGIRQLKSVTMDGVNGITECPLAPGQAQTYSFLATQFGTTWYHSHHSAQYGDGIFGAIVINGPSSSNYDFDMGPTLLNELYYQPAFQVSALTNAKAQMGQPGPASDGILIAGKGKNAANTSGSYTQYNMTKGKKYLFRLINASMDSALRVSIDNHTMQVITADFVPVKPVVVDSVMLAIGQRYHVLVSANQAVGSYWMRAVVESACASACKVTGGLAVVSYGGAPPGNPNSSTTAIDRGCNSPDPLTPWVPNTVGNSTAFINQAKQLDVNLYLPGTTTNNANIVVWGVNMSAIDVQWEIPTLNYVATGNMSYPQTENLIEIPKQGIWTYWIIQEVQGGIISIPHPIHLHGHDFYILGTGTGKFDIDKDPANLTYSNPTRRDTATLPAAGWLVIAFPTDNPGAWLMHCHIAWHIAEGLGVQFLESKSLIAGGSPQSPGPAWNNQCSAWNRYYSTSYWKKDDSGL